MGVVAGLARGWLKLRRLKRRNIALGLAVLGGLLFVTWQLQQRGFSTSGDGGAPAALLPRRPSPPAPPPHEPPPPPPPSTPSPPPPRTTARRIVHPPGREEMLAAINHSEAEKTRETSEGYRRNGFNQYLSDRISLHRDLTDPRSPLCHTQQYRPEDQLPATTVVIPFHNEARSALLRTVWSVLDKSPPRLIVEIILVDDASDMSHLGAALDDEVASIPKTRILRLKERSGLIRAKVAGALEAKGEVLTFLDSHCECHFGWLEPLLDRIRDDHRNVVTPVIDSIDMDSFKYLGGPETTTRGIFSWSLTFTWLDLPYEAARARESVIAPLRSPTMAGGLFSMDRKYFFDIGSYDLGMEIWGGENLEISFRIWLCGGQLEIIQCSRVGHIFRKSHPYKFPGGTGGTINRNLNRVAEVWLDEYKELYYEIQPHHRAVGTGDIAERVELRRRLQCRPFKWYLDNVFPDMFVPLDDNVHGRGNIRNPHFGVCVDTTTTDLATMKPRLVSCTLKAESDTSRFFLTKKLDDIRVEGAFGSKCLDSSNRQPFTPVDMYGCHGMRGNQEWTYLASLQLRHVISGTCLEAYQAPGTALPVPVINTCDPSNPAQRWTFSRFSKYGDSLSQ